MEVSKVMICDKEEIIQRIKDCGQELINHAEDIANNYEYPTDLTINCYINWCDDIETPRINIETELIPERFIKRLRELSNA